MVGIDPDRGIPTRPLVAVVVVSVVAFAFWRALFAGGSLVAHDFVQTAPPFEAHRSPDLTVEAGPGDPILIHGHWESFASDVRSGDIGWWDRDLAGGQPTMKGGLPPFNLLYLLVPGWYAPGLVAAVRTLVAIGLTYGLLRAVELRRLPALVGGLSFGFSGFMVGWMNWPHSSVAALAPGLLWAIEALLRRPQWWRAVPLAAVVAAMVWSNFPQVTVFVLLGAGTYALIRATAELTGDGRASPGTARRWLGIGVVAAGLALLFVAPHLHGFAEYLSWADTSHRDTGVDDSSAGIAHLLTMVAPWIWGSEAGGPLWFGQGNWTEFQIHAGASVVVLALLGAVAGVGWGTRRSRSVALAAVVIAGLGVVIAYVGGPVGVLFGDVVGDRGGLMTRAKVLVSLGVALLAAIGVQAWTVDHATNRASHRRVAAGAGLLALAALVVMGRSLLDWYDTVRGLGVTGEVLGRSTPSMLGLLGVLVVLAARGRGHMTGPGAAWALVGVVTFESLSFAMPVPTTVDRHERLHETPAHVQVRDTLEPGEQLAGEGGTFFAGTTAHFGIPDARGQVLKPPGYQELLRAVDPAMFQVGGGTPTNPNVPIGTDPSSPVWDALAVGVWAAYPDSTVPGTALGPASVGGIADPAVAPLRGRVTVPDGGLRAVIVEVAVTAITVVDYSVHDDGGAEVARLRRRVRPEESGRLQLAVAGESLAVGSEVTVTVSVDSEAGVVLASTDADGGLALGTVAGDDDLTLVRAGDVLLFDRGSASFARLHDAALVAADAGEAAAIVAARRVGAPAVVDRVVELPSEPDPAARLEVVDVEVGTDRTAVRVVTDRPALLVLAQVHYPGWTATLDGDPVETVVADAAFTGVVVPAGEHEVVLSFRPEALRRGVAVLVVGLALAVGLIAAGRRRGDLRMAPLRSQ